MIFVAGVFSGVGLMMALAGSRALERGPLLAAERMAEPTPVPAVWRSQPTRSGGFDVDAPRWRPLGFEARQFRRMDGVSRDVFSFGEATGERRHALIAVERGHVGSEDALAEVQGLAGDLGVPMRAVEGHGSLDTKFGPLPIIDMAIEGVRGPKACLGFAFRSREANIRLAGWVCSPGPELVDRREAACLVDRLVTIGSSDPAVTRVFARAELRRQSCPAAQAASGPGPSAVPQDVVGRLRPGLRS